MFSTATLNRHGEGWEMMRDAVGSDGGWIVGLRAFAPRVRSAKIANDV